MGKGGVGVDTQSRETSLKATVIPCVRNDGGPSRNHWIEGGSLDWKDISEAEATADGLTRVDDGGAADGGGHTK